MKLLRSRVSDYCRVFLCVMIISVVFPTTMISAYNVDDVKEELSLKLALDTDHNGLDVADIVRYMLAADEPMQPGELHMWMGQIDAEQHVVLEIIQSICYMAEGLIIQGNQGSEEAYIDLDNTYQAVGALLDQADLKQRQVDEHTLALLEAIIEYNDSVVPGPLEFISPELVYANGFNSSGWHQFQVTGGVGPYNFELLEEQSDSLPEKLILYTNGWLDWFERLELGEYSFKVQVTDSLGEQATQSVMFNVIYFLKIDDLEVLPGVSQAQFEFSAPIAASQVQMQQSSDSGETWSYVPEDRIGVLDTSATSATVTGLENGVTYQFRLDVTGGPNDGKSNVVSVQPNKLLATSGDGNVVLHFEPQAHATIQQSETGGLHWTDLAELQISPDTTSVTISNLTNGKAYMYRMLVNGDVYSNEVIAVPVSPSSESSGHTLRTPDSVIVTFDPNIGFSSFMLELNNDYLNRQPVTLGMPLYNHSTFVQIVDLQDDLTYKIVGFTRGGTMYPNVTEVYPNVKLTAALNNDAVMISHDGRYFELFNKTGQLQRLKEGQQDWEDIGTITDSSPFIDSNIESEGTYHYRMLITSSTYFELSETVSVEVLFP